MVASHAFDINSCNEPYCVANYSIAIYMLIIE